MRQRERFAKVFRCIEHGNYAVHMFGVHFQTTKAMVNRGLLTQRMCGGVWEFYMTEEGIKTYNAMKEGVQDV
jgi:hypothetical protein